MLQGRRFKSPHKFYIHDGEKIPTITEAKAGGSWCQIFTKSYQGREKGRERERGGEGEGSGGGGGVDRQRERGGGVNRQTDRQTEREGG